MIKANRCHELNLPEPKPYQDQRAYVLAALMDGHSMNTRAARYIGIGNLHSLLPVLRKQWALTVEHRAAYCPDEKATPPQPVDWAYMTPEQRALNRERMKGRQGVMTQTEANAAPLAEAEEAHLLAKFG